MSRLIASYGLAVELLRRQKRVAILAMLRKCLSLDTLVLLVHLRRHRSSRRPQAETLQRLLVFCTTYVPYYRRAFLQLADADAIRFTDLPVMSKATLQAHFPEMIAVRPGGAVHGSAPFWITSTSGSTGISSSILKSRADMLANISVVQEIFREHKVPRFGHLFDLGMHWTGQPLAQARVMPGAFVCWNFTGYSLDLPLLRQECIDVLSIARPSVIYGAPSRVMPFTELCRSIGATVRPSLVITTYEHLPDAGAAYVSETFDSSVVQIYGTAETGPLGWTCRLGRWHFDPQTVAVELVDSNGGYVAPGETGRLLVTPLWHRTMPLIRFDTGDIGRCPEGPCSCGRAGTVIDALEGRASEVLRTRSGKAFSPFSVFRYISDIGMTDWQLVQRRRGELEIIVPPGASVPAGAVERLTARVSSYLQEEATVLIRHSDFIRTHNGKRNAFVRLTDDEDTH